MTRVSVDLHDELFIKAKNLTGLKTPEKIVTRALELLVQSEARKGILRFYDSGIWQGSEQLLQEPCFNLRLSS
jgi:Arc/MetJ family transcription regulator